MQNEKAILLMAGETQLLFCVVGAATLRNV